MTQEDRQRDKLKKKEKKDFVFTTYIYDVYKKLFVYIRIT